MPLRTTSWGQGGRNTNEVRCLLTNPLRGCRRAQGIGGETMEVHISITGDDESVKKVLDILTGGRIVDNLETTVKPKKHAGRPKKHIEKDIDMNEVSEKIFGK